MLEFGENTFSCLSQLRRPKLIVKLNMLLQVFIINLIQLLFQGKHVIYYIISRSASTRVLFRILV